jgi:hypothetical protein
VSRRKQEQGSVYDIRNMGSLRGTSTLNYLPTCTRVFHHRHTITYTCARTHTQPITSADNVSTYPNARRHHDPCAQLERIAMSSRVGLTVSNKQTPAPEWATDSRRGQRCLSWCLSRFKLCWRFPALLSQRSPLRGQRLAFNGCRENIEGH